MKANKLRIIAHFLQFVFSCVLLCVLIRTMRVGWVVWKPPSMFNFLFYAGLLLSSILLGSGLMIYTIYVEYSRKVKT